MMVIMTKANQNHTEQYNNNGDSVRVNNSSIC